MKRRRKRSEKAMNNLRLCAQVLRRNGGRGEHNTSNAEAGGSEANCGSNLIETSPLALK